MGVPGCPELAAWTASMARPLTTLIARASTSFVITPLFMGATAAAFRREHSAAAYRRAGAGLP
jgi:hypothetical protein